MLPRSALRHRRETIGAGRSPRAFRVASAARGLVNSIARTEATDAGGPRDRLGYIEVAEARDRVGDEAVAERSRRSRARFAASPVAVDPACFRVADRKSGHLDGRLVKRRSSHEQDPRGARECECSALCER